MPEQDAMETSRSATWHRLKDNLEREGGHWADKWAQGFASGWNARSEENAELKRQIAELEKRLAIEQERDKPVPNSELSFTEYL